MASLEIYFDKEFEGWIVSKDIQLAEGTSYGEILTIANTKSQAEAFLKKYSELNEDDASDGKSSVCTR